MSGHGQRQCPARWREHDQAILDHIHTCRRSGKSFHRCSQVFRPVTGRKPAAQHIRAPRPTRPSPDTQRCDPKSGRRQQDQLRAPLRPSSSDFRHPIGRRPRQQAGKPHTGFHIGFQDSFQFDLHHMTRLRRHAASVSSMGSLPEPIGASVGFAVLHNPRLRYGIRVIPQAKSDVVAGRVPKYSSMMAA